MRGLFYRHRKWQKLNLALFIVAVGCALFFHGVLNTIAVFADTPYRDTLAVLLSDGRIGRLLSESNFWVAQLQGFFAVFTNLSLWLSILWLPVSLALIILAQGFGVLLNRPRWQVSLLLITLAVLASLWLPQWMGVDANTQQLAHGPAAALYFSIAAAIFSAARLRTHHAH